MTSRQEKQPAIDRTAPRPRPLGKPRVRGEAVSSAGRPEPRLDSMRHPLLTELGAAVRSRRLALGMTRQVLATHAGLSLRFLAEVESGQANVSVLKLADLAQALGVPLPSLLASDGTAMLAPGHPPVIALVGLRGAGKSTVGPLLAARLAIPFVELDTLIQEGSGLALPELFELHGESFYRRTEREALARVVEAGKPCVLAASGGIVTDPQALGLLRERTLMVWLKARPEQYIPRLEAQGDRRPMANRPNAQAQLQALLRARTPYYRQARLALDTSEQTPEACVDRLTEEIQRLGPGEP